MTYEELVESARVATKKTQVSKAVGHMAYQFNIKGEGEGAFYIEIDEGKINVEPYEYYDRDVLVVTSADMLMNIIKGRIRALDAYANGQIMVYGDPRNLEYLMFS
ncbi:MAG: SCP2 sterol-binding domain-containing protein [Lachnospiraceae bacterium]|nr:SCP2 sterol-binding domain-containing protein [Lachnospiraceae bacterium]